MNGLSVARNGKPREPWQLLLNDEMILVFLKSVMSRVRLRRLPAVALFLLACLCLSEIAESAHNHYESSSPGRQSSRLRANPSGVAQLSIPGASRNGTLRQRDCLLCQLHRNLFATALRHGVYNTPAALGCLSSNALTAFVESISTTSQRGRAPPPIIL